MRFRHIRAALAAGGALALVPAAGRGQDLGLVEGLFEEVSAVTIFYQGGLVPFSDEVSADGLHGGGTEVLINLKSGDRMSYELGLGASYLRGYQAVEPSLDLRASLRALPTVSLYTTWEREPVSRYLGLGFGLVELWNAQAYGESGQPWTVEANTFEVVLSGGLYLETTFAEGLFVEGGYRFRNFHSVTWTPSDEDEELPAEWPRSLDFSGPFLSLGWQLQLEKEDDEQAAITPPAPAGTWLLERVDGAPLPTLLDAPRGGRREVVHGVLRLRPDTADAESGRGEFTLEMNVRGQDGVMSLVAERGTYTRDGEILSLSAPGGPGQTRRLERLAGRLYLQREGHVLVFAPGGGEPDE